MIYLDSHAGAIQAICAILTFVLSIVGMILVLKTLKASRMQAKAAFDQSVMLQRQNAESLRPVIVVRVADVSQVLDGLRWVPDGAMRLELKNDGLGPAIEMDGPYTQTTTILGAKSSCTVAVIGSVEYNLTIKYKSLDERSFETKVTIFNYGNCIHEYREIKG
jgi:hypothetical protein